MAEDGQTLHSTDLAPEITTAWNNRPMAPADQPAGPSVTILLDQPPERAV